MKPLIAALAIMMVPICVRAQRNNVFADAGVHLGNFTPGASVTYNRKLTKHFGVGGGAQMYMDYVSVRGKDHTIYKPAIYGDVRGYFPVRKSILFLLGDVGMHIYDDVTALNSGETRNNGVYVGTGIGYGHGIGKRHVMDGYLSLKMVTDSYTIHETNSGHEYSTFNMDGTLVISAGVRF